MTPPLLGRCRRVGGESPSEELPIYVRESVLHRILEHVRGDLSRELGGLLVGNFCRDGDQHWLDVSDLIPADHTHSDATSLRFTVQTWGETDRVLEERYPEEERIGIGWYHSHPGLSVFVSSRDREVHALFSSWWQIALVVDPKAGSFGCFRVRDGDLRPCAGVFLYGDEGPPERGALAYRVDMDTAEAPGKSWPEPWDEEVSPVTSPDHAGGDGSPSGSIGVPHSGETSPTSAGQPAPRHPTRPRMPMPSPARTNESTLALGLAILGLGVVVAALLAGLFFGGRSAEPQKTFASIPADTAEWMQAVLSDDPDKPVLVQSLAYLTQLQSPGDLEGARLAVEGALWDHFESRANALEKGARSEKDAREDGWAERVQDKLRVLVAILPPETSGHYQEARRRIHTIEAIAKTPLRPLGPEFRVLVKSPQGHTRALPRSSYACLQCVGR